MKINIKVLEENQFLRNVSTLVLGTGISQVVVLISSLFLARLYSVEQFGILSVFTSFSFFFAVLSTGRYELAIGLPADDYKAKKIISLIVKIGLVISSIYLILILFLKQGLNFVDSAGFLKYSNSYLSPLYIFFIAIFSAFGYWFQRHKRYKEITVANSIQVITAAIFNLLFGYLKVFDGLVFSLVIGVICALLYLTSKDSQLLKLKSQSQDLLAIAKEYRYFPKYMIASDLSLTASQQFIPVLFSALFSTTIVGFFSMANRIIRLPNILITSAIGNVFRNDAIDQLREKGNCIDLFYSTLKKLILLSLPAYLILFLVSPTLFVVLFGEKWRTAGEFSQILCLMLSVEFVVSPLNTLFYVVEKQKLLMQLQILNSIIGALIIYLSYQAFNNPKLALLFFCCNSVLFNFIFLYNSHKLAKNVK